MAEQAVDTPPAETPTAQPGDAPHAETLPWYSGMPEETRGWVQNKGWDNAEAAVAGYRELEKFTGGPAERLLALPEDMADAEAMGGIWNKLGRPETKDGYDIQMPDVGGDQNMSDWFAAKAHEKGLSTKQGNELSADFNEYVAEVIKADADALTLQREAEIQGLQREWGQNYDGNIEVARRAAAAFKLSPDKDENQKLQSAMENALGTVPYLKLWQNIGWKINGDIPTDGAGTILGFGTNTKEQLVSKHKELMDAIQADPARYALYQRESGRDFNEISSLIQQITNFGEGT